MVFTTSVIREMAEELLSDIDYDIYKEDLEEDFGAISGIEDKIKTIIEACGKTILED